MCGSMVDIQYATAESRRGKKIEDRRNHRTKNIMACEKSNKYKKEGNS